MQHMGGLSDITPGRMVRGANAVIARLWHIVEAPKGSIPQDPTLGWGLPLKLGTKTSAAALKTEEALGRDELKKDPDIADVRVTISELDRGRYRVEINATLTSGAALQFENEIEAQ